MKRILGKVYERHSIAFLLLCYFVILSDGRQTSGVVGFMLINYSPYFVWALAIWSLIGALWLILRKAKPITMAIASLPILAYAVMGAVFVQTNWGLAPIAGFVIHFGVYVTVLILISLRIRSMAKGLHSDDSLPTRPNG